MKAALVLNLGAAIILGVLFVALLYTVPARAETCGIWTTWYGTESGNRTANGESFDGTSLTAAHRTHAFGTKLRVSYKGKSVVVRVNDRGPAKWTGNSLDLSKAAAQRIGMLHAGRVKTCVQEL